MYISLWVNFPVLSGKLPSFIGFYVRIRYTMVHALHALRKRARALGASDLKKSTRAGKKYMVSYQGRIVHFGAAGMSDYTIHKDPDRRARYRARHRKILTKDGRPAYMVKGSPAYFSWNLLW